MVEVAPLILLGASRCRSLKREMQKVREEKGKQKRKKGGKRKKRKGKGVVLGTRQNGR